MNTALHFSSATDLWATPIETYNILNEEFGFTLDVCATSDNAKCARFFTKEQDGLSQDWTGEIVWCNPPYGMGIGKWVKKCRWGKAKVAVALLPARTDTAWFHDHIYHHTADMRFIRGRLRFGGHKNPAPFPSMIVCWKTIA